MARTPSARKQVLLRDSMTQSHDFTVAAERLPIGFKKNLLPDAADLTQLGCEGKGT
jgi:hypothetical protein